MYKELKDLKAILWLRCSSKQQASTSIDDQEKAIRSFAADNGMVIVDVEKLEGVSGSIRKNIEDEVERLIDRKTTKNDFNAILVHDQSRFSRTGARHSMRLLDDLEAAGIQLVPAIGYVPRNDFSDLSDVHGAVISREHAKRISQAVSRGQQSSIEQGRKAHCSFAPFGLDKLILAADGKVVHRLRNRPDGEQWRIDPKTCETIEVYPRNVPGCSSSHFRKAKEQRVQLIPGDPAEVEVVRMIYLGSMERRMGAHSIAKALNDAGKPSPRGNGWASSTVRSILKNPIYTGRGICNRRTTAIYYHRNADRPVERKSVRATASGNPAQKLRPREEWEILEYPDLAEMLPERIREAARRWHDALMDENALGRERAPAKDKHGASEYLLKGILTAKQGGIAMTGVAGGNSGRRYRYYQVRRGFTSPQSNSIFGRRLPAGRIEDAVLGEIRKMLLTMPLLRERVIEQTLEWQRSRLANGVDRSDVERELASVKKKIANLVQVGEAVGVDEVLSRLETLGKQKRALEQQLRPVAGWEELTEAEVGAVVDELLYSLQELGRGMGTLPRPQLRQLLETIVESAIADLETGRVEVVLRVPSWAAADVGLDRNSLYWVEAEANSLAFYRVETWFDFPKGKRAA